MSEQFSDTDANQFNQLQKVYITSALIHRSQSSEIGLRETKSRERVCSDRRLCDTRMFSSLQEQRKSTPMSR